MRRGESHPERLGRKGTGSYFVNGETGSVEGIHIARQSTGQSEWQIVGVVPAKTPRMTWPSNDGRSTVGDNWQTQR